MPKVVKPIINYTGRDFAAIKQELTNYAQKYYPETFRDFNEASFGSLMLDMVSYVGDIISFYTDYQANESFMDTALEFSNVLKLSKQFGYKFRPNASSFGEASFFITVPVIENSITPDYTYAPILRRGSVFSTTANQIFTLVEDVDFESSTDFIEVGSSNVDGTSPSRFAIKAKGTVVSGELEETVFAIDDYEKFLRLKINDSDITEIVSVFDSQGNNYYEVDYLTQDVVYVPVLNTSNSKKYAKNIYKPISVPRRFTTEFLTDGAELQFGFGTNDNEEKKLDPTSMSLDIFGKEHITEKSFDPTILLKTNKLGIVPSNTALTVIYRRNSQAIMNAPVDTLVNVVNSEFSFKPNVNVLDAEVSLVQSSLQLTNEEQITGDSAQISSQELKIRSQGAFSSQNRAVTADDYVSLCYNMPANFGQIKRASLTRDQTSFNGKNLNLYIMSTDSNGKLADTNIIVKQNLRNWINQYKMVGDTVDILDGRIINLQINFELVSFANINKFDVLSECVSTLSDFYTGNYYDFGEPFKITDVYKVLNNIPSVVDTKLVTVTQKFGTNYSNVDFNFDEMISNDGRHLIAPENAIFEVKFPSADITGEVI
tara:strand:+ start:10949 stop:12745 length:1797 start_codon:yes stop_codon:yes gene_type:complete